MVTYRDQDSVSIDQSSLIGCFWPSTRSFWWKSFSIDLPKTLQSMSHQILLFFFLSYKPMISSHRWDVSGSVTWDLSVREKPPDCASLRSSNMAVQDWTKVRESKDLISPVSGVRNNCALFYIVGIWGLLVSSVQPYMFIINIHIHSAEFIYNIFIWAWYII